MRARLLRRASIGALALTLIGATAAVADDISNSLDGTIDSVAEVMPLNVGGPNGTTTLYVQPRNGDGDNGCNFQGSESMTASVASSNPSIASVSPSSVTFGSCGDVIPLNVTPLVAGSTTISLTQTTNNTGGTFNFAPATFTVNVTAATNTAPHIAVTGVGAGASYAKGSVPAAGCSVTDAEDGPSTFPATLSAITGTDAIDGIGLQTASCSYTDAGGLQAADSVTYLITDPTAPVITYTLDPATPDGSNGWWVSNVSLTWHVTEPESPHSLQLAGCQDQNITADQFETTYSCSASSAGGAATQQRVTIKRDASAPSGSLVLTKADDTPYAPGTWTNQDVTAHYANCQDNGPSGLSAGSSCPADLPLSEGVTTIPDITLTDNAGNAFVIKGADVSIDQTAPQAKISLRDPDHGQWYNHALDYTVADTASDDLSPVTCDPPSGSYNAPDSSTASISAKCTDEAGNSGSATVHFQYDGTAPTLNPIVSTSPVVLNAPATASSGAMDAVSGIESESCGAVSTSIVGPDQPVTCSATNGAGLSNVATAYYSVVYANTGTCLGEAAHQVLQPVNPDGTSVFKQGSTVPVKFRVCDANGASIGTPGVVTKFALVKKTSLASDAVVDEAVLSTTPDSAFRWDATSQQWIFNLSTKTLTKGTVYSYLISLNDGSQISFKFGLK